MSTNTKRIVFLILTLLIGLADILYNHGGGFTELALALASSTVIFFLPQLKIKLPKLPSALLFLVNTGVLVTTYLVYNQKIFLINIVIFSYFVWNLITPYIREHKLFLPVTFMFSFITVYAGSFLDFSVPLFTVAFYPVYALGAIVQDKNIIKTPKTCFFAVFNLLTSAALLAIFLFKSLGQSIMGSILFLYIEKSGTLTAVYLPFIAVFLAWFSLSANFLFLMLVSRFTKGYHSFELTDYAKPLYNFMSFFAVATIATFICELSIRQNLSATVRTMLDPNILFNILFLCSIYLCMISLIGKGISNILIAIVCIFLTGANYIKFTYFDEPFYPWDLYMFQNLIGICKEYINIPVMIAVIAAIALGVFLMIKYRRSVTRYLKPRISFILIPFAAIITLISATVLFNYSLSSQIGVGKSWYIGKDEILTNGMFAQNVYYLDDLDKYLRPKPDNYSDEAMKAIDSKYGSKAVSTNTSSSNSAQKPNVIMIMSESFWDITKLNGITFSKDIAENVHLHQKGQIASPVIGGGTANTEFEALTGMSMYFSSPGIIVYNAYLRTETPSLASVFKDNGYSTVAIHPNYGWFYNRDKVYSYFGFDKFLDSNSFNLSADFKGPNISDDAFVDKILETVNSSDNPTFVFALSMENHDPYKDKYTSQDVTVESDQLSATEKNIVANYAQGMYDADQSLGKLIKELEKSDRPTLVYFFGDHAPRLGSLSDYYKIYDRLGTNDTSAQDQGLGDLKYYTTPFASWSNYTELPALPEIVSPSHIAYEILRDAGVKYPNYFNILPALEKTYPVMHMQKKDIVDAESSLVKDYQLIQYDLLFGKKYLD